VLFLATVAIGLSPIFVRLSELPPTATAFWRAALAAPLFLPIATGLFGALGSRVSARLLVLAGLCFAGDLFFWHWSIRHTTVANATFLANMAPFFVTLAMWLFFGQRFGGRFLGGLAIALAGAALMVGGDVSFRADRLLGDGFGVITAMFYAAYMIAVTRVRGHVSVGTVMAAASVITALALAPFVFLLDEPFWPTTARGWLVLVALAWISHAAGQGLIALAMAHLPAAFAAVALLTQPICAALFGWAILDESLSVTQGIGALVILGGIAIARRAG
jgi:drug/metabolite transporter (DMT)-like permease